MKNRRKTADERGNDWEHGEIFRNDDEAVGNDPEEREDLAPEIPAPPEIKQDSKPGKDETPSTAKSSALPKGASPSSKTAPSPATGPVTDDEIRAVLLQGKPVTTLALVTQFESRFNCKEDKAAFLEVMRRISILQRTSSGIYYRILRKD